MFKNFQWKDQLPSLGCPEPRDPPFLEAQMWGSKVQSSDGGDGNSDRLGPAARGCGKEATVPQTV